MTSQHLTTPTARYEVDQQKLLSLQRSPHCLLSAACAGASGERSGRLGGSLSPV